MKARLNLHVGSSIDWESVFAAHRTQLILVVESLLACRGCTHLVMREAGLIAQRACVPIAFQPSYAVRCVVQASLAHLRQCNLINPPFVPLEDGDPIPLAALPLPERIVYFLSEILNYSRRDVSLLAGIGDSETARRLASARLRLQRLDASPARPAQLEMPMDGPNHPPRTGASTAKPGPPSLESTSIPSPRPQAAAMYGTGQDTHLWFRSSGLASHRVPLAPAV